MFDWFRESVFAIADRDYGNRMIGVRERVTEALGGGMLPALLRPSAPPAPSPFAADPGAPAT